MPKLMELLLDTREPMCKILQTCLISLIIIRISFLSALKASKQVVPAVASLNLTNEEESAWT